MRVEDIEEVLPCLGNSRITSFDASPRPSLATSTNAFDICAENIFYAGSMCHFHYVEQDLCYKGYFNI